MRVGRCGGRRLGETENRPFQLSFDSALRVDFQGARVTSDGGLILVRELDERLGLSELMDRHLSDSRRGKNIQLPLADLLRQSICSRLAATTWEHCGTKSAKALHRKAVRNVEGVGIGKSQKGNPV